MSRPLRIEYQGAWYHVMNRGAGYRAIFKTSKHFEIFLKLLKEVSHLFSAEIHGYCLLNNHYHLLLHTPRGNLSRIMRHIDGVYTQRFNYSEKTDGPLFRGRYKALLIEVDAYLLQVSRYIHLNPVLAKLVKKPEDYQWSSYRSYLNKDRCYDWLYTGEILERMNSAEPILNYRRYVDQGIDEEMEKFYSRKAQSSILGSRDFKTIQLEALNNRKVVESRHDIRRTRDVPSIEDVLSAIADNYKMPLSELKVSKYGTGNLPRLLTMLICRQEYGHKMKDIARIMTRITPSAVSASINRITKRLLKDEDLWQMYSLLLRSFKKQMS